MLHEEIEFTRDCQAEQIPQGREVIIPQGARAIITQALGDTYRVHLPALGGLYRIADKDADALGKKSKAMTVAALAQSGHETVTEEMVWEQLKEVYDPEIPINVVDLGLIYDLRLDFLPDGKKKVLVQMTLT